MTTQHQLPSEIISLIHHVELNESGWWQKAVTQVLKGVMWKHNTPLTTLEIGNAIYNETGYHIAETILEKLLEKCQKQNSIIQVFDKYKLSEATSRELTEAHAISLASQKACEDSFFAACKVHTPSTDENLIWKHFRAALYKNIKILGANLYHLISDGKLDKECDWFTLFISKFDTELHISLKNIIKDFFASNNKACRNQLLQLLCAHFFAEATQLNENTIRSFESNQKNKSIKIVLDTNFIFSILDLHENPGNEPSVSLLEIAADKNNYIDLKLYVLPSTLEETKNVLISQKRAIEKIRTTRAMSRAALNEPLTSIAKKFFVAAEATPGLTSDIYFEKYISSLDILLKSKGISILDAHPNIYSKKQEVIDDILDEQKHEETKFIEEKRKTYETLQHDVILWHAVRDRRPTYSNSPFEIEYWAVSNDWRLIDFDRRKKDQLATALPVILHPSNLIQFLQFWIPRSEKLDDILVDSLNLPIYFNSYDHEDEKVTVTILTAISHYKNTNDLSEETIREILTDKALKQRIKNEHPNEKAVFDLIHKGMLKKHNTQKDELLKTKELLSQTTDINKKNNEHINKVETERDRTTLELAKKKYLELFIYIPLIAGIILSIFSYLALSKLNYTAWILPIAVLMILLPPIISSLFTSGIIEKEPRIENWSFSKMHRKTRTLLVGAVFLAISTSFQEIISIITTKHFTL